MPPATIHFPVIPIYQQAKAVSIPTSLNHPPQLNTVSKANAKLISVYIPYCLKLQGVRERESHLTDLNIFTTLLRLEIVFVI